MTIPAGTAVAVHVLQKLEGATSKEGDTFQIQTVTPVMVQNKIVIPQGAAGQGHITALEHGKHHGHGGKMTVTIDFIDAPNGQRIDLMSDHTSTFGKGDTGASTTVTLVTTAGLGFPGLFAHNFFKGGDAVILPSNEMQAFTKNTVTVANQPAR